VGTVFLILKAVVLVVMNDADGIPFSYVMNAGPSSSMDPLYGELIPENVIFPFAPETDHLTYPPELVGRMSGTERDKLNMVKVAKLDDVVLESTDMYLLLLNEMLDEPLAVENVVFDPPLSIIV
jgi:hypothetical protein